MVYHMLCMYFSQPGACLFFLQMRRQCICMEYGLNLDRWQAVNVSMLTCCFRVVYFGYWCYAIVWNRGRAVASCTQRQQFAKSVCMAWVVARQICQGFSTFLGEALVKPVSCSPSKQMALFPWSVSPQTYSVLWSCPNP